MCIILKISYTIRVITYTKLLQKVSNSKTVQLYALTNFFSVINFMKWYLLYLRVNIRSCSRVKIRDCGEFDNPLLS